MDVTACPGTDSCKLGIASSRGLARELYTRLAEKSVQLDEAVRNLRIKISGCFNSCGQHHIADIGFYGVSKTIKGYTVPHFRVVLGGKWADNAGAYGLAMGAVPSKRIPEVVDRITERYVRERAKGENFQAFIQFNTSASHRQEGTGLGLHLSQKLAGLLGGRISFTSEYGKGSSFTLTLPNP